jgi:hypothetical protein
MAKGIFFGIETARQLPVPAAAGYMSPQSFCSRIYVAEEGNLLALLGTAV